MIRKVGVKVFKLDTFDRAPGNLIYEGVAEIRECGTLSRAFVERSAAYCENNGCNIRVETPDNPKYRLHFYKKGNRFRTTSLFNFFGVAIRGDSYLLIDQRSSQNRALKRGRVIGYINKGDDGYFLTGDVYRHLIFYEEMPRLTTLSEAVSWVWGNATGWRDVPPKVKEGESK